MFSSSSENRDQHIYIEPSRTALEPLGSGHYNRKWRFCQYADDFFVFQRSEEILLDKIRQIWIMLVSDDDDKLSVVIPR